MCAIDTCIFNFLSQHAYDFKCVTVRYITYLDKFVRIRQFFRLGNKNVQRFVSLSSLSTDYVKSAALLKEMNISLHGTITLVLLNKDR